MTPRPDESKARHEWRPWLLAYAAVLVTRLGLIGWAPSNLLYSSDELRMAHASLDRFLGLPSITLAWPGTLLLMLDTPLAGLRVAAGCLHGGAKDLSCLSAGLGRAYIELGTGVTELRLLSAIVSSLAPLFAFAWLRRLGAARPPSFAGALLVATIPLLWRHGAMGTGDGPAVALGLGAMTMAATSPLAAGLLAGLALTGRVTVLGLAFASLTIVAAHPHRWRGAPRWLGGATVGFLLGCPYVWTDPTRVLKSIVGNVTRAGHGAGVSQVSEALAGALGLAALPVLLLAVAGLVSLWKSAEKRPSAAALTTSLLVMTLPLAQAPVVFSRYALGLAALLCMLAPLGLDAVSQRFNPALNTRIFMVTAALPVALALFSTWLAERDLRIEPGANAVVQALAQKATGGELFVPAPAEVAAWKLMSRSRAQELLAVAERTDSDPAGATAFLQARGIEKGAATALRSAFTEDEQGIRGRLAAVAAAAPDGPWRPHVYDDNPQRPPGEWSSRLAIVETDRRGALQGFLASPSPAYFLVDCDVPEAGAAPERVGGEWRLYRR